MALGALLLGSAVAGTASSAMQLGSQAWSQSFTAEQNQLDRDFNSAEAQKQRDWEEEMSNTSYQRQVADMEAAGLNVGAIGNSGGASTPSGSSASSSGSGSSGNSVGNNFNSLEFALANTALKQALQDKDSARELGEHFAIALGAPWSASSEDYVYYKPYSLVATNKSDYYAYKNPSSYSTTLGNYSTSVR